MPIKAKNTKTIGLKELRENMEEYIARVNKGESITVFRRSTPLFKLTPVDNDSETRWETIVDFPKEIGTGMPIDELLASIKSHGQKRKVS
ncbi:MAG: type II toxin-antitoxin system prevent-host-death family antitoxin [Candidatus Nomurabacteria bacterium]|nr:type II toxin-antitoxin system prevent-host-death family antitoxin [Candidatus Nomurabacteria bacterium]USN87470.1 MAG: type II toxin-antitoxin system prevent-host-death family antitoxin [Candidatus Nomurabacteria bacterium]